MAPHRAVFILVFAQPHSCCFHAQRRHREIEKHSTLLTMSSIGSADFELLPRRHVILLLTSSPVPHGTVKWILECFHVLLASIMSSKWMSIRKTVVDTYWSHHPVHVLTSVPNPRNAFFWRCIRPATCSVDRELLAHIRSVTYVTTPPKCIAVPELAVNCFRHGVIPTWHLFAIITLMLSACDHFAILTNLQHFLPHFRPGRPSLCPEHKMIHVRSAIILSTPSHLICTPLRTYSRIGWRKIAAMATLPLPFQVLHKTFPLERHFQSDASRNQPTQHVSALWRYEPERDQTIFRTRSFHHPVFSASFEMWLTFDDWELRSRDHKIFECKSLQTRDRKSESQNVSLVWKLPYVTHIWRLRFPTSWF